MAKVKHTDPETRLRRVMSADSLSGDRVKNAAGEDLGKVKSLMIDVPSGSHSRSQRAPQYNIAEIGNRARRWSIWQRGRSAARW